METGLLHVQEADPSSHLAAPDSMAVPTNYEPIAAAAVKKYYQYSNDEWREDEELRNIA